MPVLDAQQTFRTLLNAMARPGTIHMLPHRPGQTPEQAVCFALMDFEVSYAVATPGSEVADLEQWIAVHTGCPRVAVADAAFILARGPLPDDAWASVARGTLAFPDTGATIIYALAAIGETVDDEMATRLSLSGPGIETTQELRVSGLPVAEFSARAHANREYPMGVDVIVTDPTGRVAGIPRSSRVQATTLTEGA
jgi:alpha-D-ribose 1-methylphosphonate 5-triphosphate synthase subunit PhnH